MTPNPHSPKSIAILISILLIVIPVNSNYHNDHLTGTNIVTDSSGAVVERTRYKPFGGIIEGGLSRNLFTGQEFDKESGIYYYGARYYNPTLMRFTQADPVIQNFYEPQQLNRYSYTLNNPVKYTDPSGNNPVYLAVIGGTMGLGYLGGSLWGVGEYAVTTGNYNPVDLLSNREAQKLSMERGTEGAILGGVLAGGAILENELAMRANVKQQTSTGQQAITTGETATQGAVKEAAVTTATNTEVKGFASQAKLYTHFKDHASEFGFKTDAEYLQAAKNFASQKPGGNILQATRGSEWGPRAGDRVIYNTATNEFAVISKGGIIRTYMKPEKGLEYFKHQY